MQVPDRIRYTGLLFGTFANGATAELQALARRRSAGAARSPATPPASADPLGEDVHADPAAWYRSLHARGPVHHNARRRTWIISGFDEVRAAARAHDVLSSAEGITPYRLPVPMLVATDRPAHARLRRILARDFTKEAVARRRPRVEQLCDELLDAMAGPPPADAYAGLAAPLPLMIIADILGVPEAGRSALRRWSDAAVRGFLTPPTPRNAARLTSVLLATGELFASFAKLIEQRRTRPGDDALSRLVTFEDEEGALSTTDLLWFCELLLVAGNETTTSLILALLHCLAEDPGQYALLREDRSLIGAAVEEGLRFSTPIRGFFRTARAPYEVGGVTIPEGARVLLSFGAANRDPPRFPAPDRFDVRREAGEHLAFGSGIHYCLGAHLARLEATIVLERLLDRVERLEPAGPPRWRRNPSLYGIEELPLRLSPR